MNRQKIFDYALKTFLFLSPLFFFQTYKLSFARGMFFILGTFVLFAISLGLEQKRKFSNVWLSVFLLLAFVRMFFDNGLSNSPNEWFNFWLSCASFIYVFCGVLLFHIVYCHVDKPKEYFKVILYVCVLNSALTFAQLIGMDFMWTRTPSLCGFMENSSQLGQYSALALPILFYLNPFYALIPLFTLVAAQSVSPILASVVGIALFGGFKGRILKIKVIVAVVLVLWLSFNLGYVMTKFQCRPIAWQKTLKVALQKPYLGHGYRTFQEKVMGIKEKGTLGGVEFTRVHNDFIHTAQEVGFPIVICIALFFIGLYKKFKVVPKDKLINCLAVSVLIVLINMTGQTFVRYASVAGTFIVLLALFCIKVQGGENGNSQ